MSVKTPLALALALTLGCLATRASAEELSQKSMAQALFDHAVDLAEARRYDEAIAKFEASFRLDPARGTLQGWATAEERAGRLLDALTHFRQLEKWALDANDQERATLARRRIQSIDARLPRLSIDIVGPTPPGASITLDGVALGPGSFGRPFQVNPGSHVVRGSTPDGWSFSQMVSLTERAASRVEVEWNRRSAVIATQPAPRDSAPASPAHGGNGRRTLGYVVTGAGVALLGVAAYSGVKALSLKNDRTYQDYRQSSSSSNLCDQAASEGREDVVAVCDDSKKYSTIAYVTAPLGLVATGVGIYLLATSGGGSQSSRLLLTPALGPRRGYLDVSYRF